MTHASTHRIFGSQYLDQPTLTGITRRSPKKASTAKSSQGKLLGGSSAINGLAFVTQSKAAIDAWADFGNPGWDWETLPPTKNSSIPYHALHRPRSSTCVSPICRKMRAVPTDLSRHPSPRSRMMPFPRHGSTRSRPWASLLPGIHSVESSPGGCINALNVDPVSSTRSDAATWYFELARSRPNLHVVTGALAENILFDTTGEREIPKAVGCKFKRTGRQSR